MVRTARFINLLLSSQATSVFVGTWAAVSPSTRDFPPATYTLYQQATIRNLIPVMGVLLPGAALSSLVVLVVEPDKRSPAFYLTLTGLVAQLGLGGITQRVNMPINKEVLTWSPEHPPAAWQRKRDRWEAAHTVRAVVAVGGLAALFAAALAAPAKRALKASKR